ncbi:hypothetical protein PMAYCL1PPCAC_29581, partial [Pristionchus mayeri]
MAALVLFLLPLFLIALVLLIQWWKMKDISIMIWRSYFNLARLPGPKAYPIIGSVWQFKLNSAGGGKQQQKERDSFSVQISHLLLLQASLGPLPVALVIKPEYCKQVLESNTLITKATVYGDVSSTNEKWFGRRKMLTPAFHFNVLKGYGEIFVKQAQQIMMEQLDSHADTGREVDLFPFVKRCALDIICDTAMATQVNSQIGKNSEYVNAVVRLSDMLFQYERSPWLWLKPIWYGCGLGFEFDRLVKMTTDFTRRAQRRETLIEEGQMEGGGDVMKKKKMAFLDLMLLSQENNELSDEDIREEVDTFMFEGHDTTSSGMGWTIWLLGQYPEYQALVHAEMDEVFGEDEREPSENDLKKCVYLEKCIKESLRLCPPVPLIARRLTHDLILDEFTIPKDITTLLVPMGTHRDPQEWEHPNVFYPDHFESEAVAKRHPFAYFPFSAGPRNCIGQKFALGEEKTVLSYFFRKYGVESVMPLPGNRFVPELILKPEEGVKCHLYKRVRS